MIFLDIDLLTDAFVLFESIQLFADAIVKNVGHRRKLDVTVALQHLLESTATASTASQ